MLGEVVEGFMDWFCGVLGLKELVEFLIFFCLQVGKEATMVEE